MSEFIKAQQELRANLTMQIRDVIDSAEAEGRGLDAAELEKIDRIEADIRKADQSIEVAARAEERKVEASVAAKGFIPSVSEERSASEILHFVLLVYCSPTIFLGMMVLLYYLLVCLLLVYLLISLVYLFLSSIY